MGDLINLRRVIPIDVAQCQGDCGQGRRKCNCGAGRLSIAEDTSPAPALPFGIDGPYHKRPSLLSRAWAYLWRKA